MGTITLARTADGMRLPLIVNDDGRDLPIQTDYDYPGVASTFGWSVRMVEGRSGLRNVRCLHDGTDGTIACNAGNPYASCGTTASEFITAARAWIDDNIGATANDPGYFLTD